MAANVKILPLLTFVVFCGQGTAAFGQECISLEDFSGSRVGEFPKGWKPRHENGRGVYVVTSDATGRFLKATASEVGEEADHMLGWDLRQYPVLTWKWRPLVFPVGAQEQSGKNDSALGVYIGFTSPYGALKYIWSEKVPSGTEFSTGFLGRTKIRVIAMGVPQNRDVWADARVNVAEDYKRRFERKEVANPAGFSVLTDSDDTRTTAEGDYRDFRACRK